MAFSDSDGLMSRSSSENVSGLVVATFDHFWLICVRFLYVLNQSSILGEGQVSSEEGIVLQSIFAMISGGSLR